MSGMKSRERNVRKNSRQWVSFVRLSHTIQTTSSKKRRTRSRCSSARSRNWSDGTFRRKLRVHVSCLQAHTNLLQAAREAPPFLHPRPSITTARRPPNNRKPCPRLPPSKHLSPPVSSTSASKSTRETNTNGRAPVTTQTADLWDFNLFYYEIKLFLK